MPKKKSVVWISRDGTGGYEIRSCKPKWIQKEQWWYAGCALSSFCASTFERLFPFFKMPPNSLGKITNTANALTFEIVETK
ncbi:hypothetical protein LCGC14_0359030 [marine sediment metagenome]|uniref:Uncharacterized protein n=1 Tax=marine sediment metagenome TaxID=412755 RepID=A0A0F9WGW0_9ZZZZ